MTRKIPALFALAGAIACAPAATQPAPEPGALQPAPPPRDASALPAGTDLALRLDTDLVAERLAVGQTFTARVEEPLVATNRAVVVPEDAVVTGMVTGVQASADPALPAAVRVNFVRINIEGTMHPFSAEVLRTGVPVTSADPGAPAHASPAGATLGAVVTGELRDALVGGPLGAGAGTIISLGTGDVAPVLPQGTLLHVRTRDPISLR